MAAAPLSAYTLQSSHLDPAFQKYLETGEGSLFDLLYPAFESHQQNKDFLDNPPPDTRSYSLDSEKEHKGSPLELESSPVVLQVQRRYSLLDYAFEAIEFVRNAVPYSPNYLSRSPIDYEKLGIPQDKVLEHFDTQLKIQRAPYEDAIMTPKVINMMARLAQKSGIGNCLEMVAVGYVYLRKLLPEAQIELFSIKNGNHCFAILGSGKNAVCIDFWNFDAFPASLINERLVDLEKVEVRDGISYPVLRAYDPKKQSLFRYFPSAPRSSSVT